MKKQQNQAGFTIIELSIATTVFSILLLLSLGAVARIGQMYYKGVITSQTQDVSRLVGSEIAQSIQLNSGTINNTPVVPAGNTGQFCVGDILYTYVIDKPLAGTQLHVLWADAVSADAVSNCVFAGPQTRTLTNAYPGGTNGRELLSPNMRLSKLDVKKLGSTSLYSLDMGIVFGDDTVLTSTHDQCLSDTSSSQFCSVVNLNTTVKKRL